MRLGFIGTGSMGGMLIQSFIRSQAVLPENIRAFNRTLDKLSILQEQFPGLQIASNNADVVTNCDLIFLCVKPKEYRTALAEFASSLSREQVLITITSPILVEELEELVPCQVIRAVPSITNHALSGLVLLEYGRRATDETKERLLHLLSHIGLPLEIQLPFLRISADIASCGPAFLSYTMQQIIRSAEEETGLPHETAVHLTTQMLIGVAELLKQGHFTLPELQARVCVPGGITGEGLRILQASLPGVFHHVFRITQKKFVEDQREMKEQLERQY
ncbi:late competence protein ComER [Brevibacillus laterosporus]|nr:late competence protein ComER [Brevibacillus laterosporus]TPG72953.1 late competence protein ComER [Brevibacillus laterosporus]